jgi:hypothetical protein
MRLIEIKEHERFTVTLQVSEEELRQIQRAIQEPSGTPLEPLGTPLFPLGTPLEPIGTPLFPSGHDESDGRPLSDTMRRHLFALWGEVRRLVGDKTDLGDLDRANLTKRLLGCNVSWGDLSATEGHALRDALMGAQQALEWTKNR